MDVGHQSIVATAIRLTTAATATTLVAVKLSVSTAVAVIP